MTAGEEERNDGQVAQQMRVTQAVQAPPVSFSMPARGARPDDGQVSVDARTCSVSGQHELARTPTEQAHRQMQPPPASSSTAFPSTTLQASQPSLALVGLDDGKCDVREQLKRERMLPKRASMQSKSPPVSVLLAMHEAG